MNPDKVVRKKVSRLTDLPNIGKAGAADLMLLGISQPIQLIGLCPYQMYQRLCAETMAGHDLCVLDVFISITRFMNGEAPKPWWHFTAERKQRLASIDDSAANQYQRTLQADLQGNSGAACRATP